MNKYYINCCTGDKAVVEEQKSYLMHIEEPNKPTRTGCISEENLHKFWIPVTKAEYESSLTLEEIKRNRYNFLDKLNTNDEIICRSDCLSTKGDDIEAGEVLRVESKSEDIVILWGLTGELKNKRLTVGAPNINLHFQLYNQEDRTEEYVHKNKENINDTFESICQDMIATHKAKNSDYGNSFHNLFKELGINYAYGHLREKLERVKTLKDNEAKVRGESMIDSLKDLANYAIMTIMELQNG